MSERRYSEDEMAAIFEHATRAQHLSHRHTGGGASDGGGVGVGMTLAQLREIGEEAGISPDLVTEAAGAIVRAGQPTTRRLLGFPIGVGRTVALDRRLDDEEWERLVVDLRDTFDARGTVRSEGSLRQWTNGNLQVLLEPTDTGHRLRLRTLNGNARALMATGAAVAAFSAALLVVGALAGDLAQAIGSSGPMVAVGLTLFVVGAVRIPAWARRRRDQMEDVAARLTRMLQEGSGATDDF